MTDRPAVLVVEDHHESRAGLLAALERNGYAVHDAGTGKAALAISRRTQLHAVVLDARLPDMEGLAVLKAMLQQTPGLPIIVVTAYASVDVAVEAMKLGAADFLTKPLHLGTFMRVLAQCVERAQAQGTIDPPASDLRVEMETFGLLGVSEAMQEVFVQIKRMAPHFRTVLITGESGTGKELVARALHGIGPGLSRPFVPINCATLSEQLLESEIFGHERGAFTSADTRKVGMMETAHTGTLFLDEVNEMGLSCQAKLLRALERRELRRVGGTSKIKVDLRVIGASNVSLDEWVANKRFRADLYYRLKVLTITVPPLRDRRDAIPHLAQRFVDDVARAAGLAAKRLTPAAIYQLSRYDWPGNVRELKNAMESVTLMVPGPVIDREHLPANVRGVRNDAIHIPADTTLHEAERRIIQHTVESHPTLKETARVLGIGLRTLHSKLKLYGLRAARTPGSAEVADAGGARKPRVPKRHAPRGR
jgi:DNA-binding NtrC family response regulator